MPHRDPESSLSGALREQFYAQGAQACAAQGALPRANAGWPGPNNGLPGPWAYPGAGDPCGPWAPPFPRVPEPAQLPWPDPKAAAEIAERAENCKTPAGARHCLREALNLGCKAAVLRVWSALREIGLAGELFAAGRSETLAAASFCREPAALCELLHSFGLRAEFQTASLLLASAASAGRRDAAKALVEIFEAGADPKDAQTRALLRSVSPALEQKALAQFEAGLLAGFCSKPEAPPERPAHAL